MNWQALEAIANTALVMTSGGAIAYAGRQLRHEREYRSVDNLEKQLTFFLSEPFVSARRRLAESRISAEGLRSWDVQEPPVTAFEVLDFYDHLGLLVKKGHLDVYDVWHTFYEWAQPVYVDLQPLIEDEKSNYTDHYSELRVLMRAMDDVQLRRMHKKNANHWALWTPDRIVDYYRYELQAEQSVQRERHRTRRRGGEAPLRHTGVLDSTGSEVLETEETRAGRE